MNIVFPTTAQIQKIAQDKLPSLTTDDPIFQYFPIETVDADTLYWEQLDNFTGLQAVRGLGGKPSRVRQVGAKTFEMKPGAYGEFMTIEEVELTRRRPLGQWDGTVDISEVVMLRQDQLLNRRVDRIKAISWTLATTGTFSVSNAESGITHTDTFALQTFTSSTAWSDAANSTPLADMRAIQLLSRGKSVSFGANSKLYLNRVTANQMLANTNQSDLGGRRTGNVYVAMTLEEANRIFMSEGLPQIEVYDDGYLRDSDGAFVPFIANAKGILFGARPGNQPIGAYRMTRNVNNPNAEPGAYMKVVDKGETEVPRIIEVHDGHNGGPVIYFPSALVRCTF